MRLQAAQEGPGNEASTTTSGGIAFITVFMAGSINVHDLHTGSEPTPHLQFTSMRRDKSWRCGRPGNKARSYLQRDAVVSLASFPGPVVWGLGMRLVVHFRVGPHGGGGGGGGGGVNKITQFRVRPHRGGRPDHSLQSGALQGR